MGTVTIDRPRPVPRPVVKRSAAELSAIDVFPTSEATILVVDHHRSFADMLAQALNVVAGMRCVGTAATAPEGIASAASSNRTSSSWTSRCAGRTGYWRSAGSVRRPRTPRSLVVTANCEPVWISRAAQAGASAFILKDGSVMEMTDVLRRVRRGQMIVAPTAFRGGQSTADRSSTAKPPTLTKRELEVLGKAMTAVGIGGYSGSPCTPAAAI